MVSCKPSVSNSINITSRLQLQCIWAANCKKGTSNRIEIFYATLHFKYYAVVIKLISSNLQYFIEKFYWTCIPNFTMVGDLVGYLFSFSCKIYFHADIPFLQLAVHEIVYYFIESFKWGRYICKLVSKYIIRFNIRIKELNFDQCFGLWISWCSSRSRLWFYPRSDQFLCRVTLGFAQM